MICLIDESYWKRLWCLFEVAAFYRRAGPQRMVLIPLHSSELRLLNLMFGIFFTVGVPAMIRFFAGYLGVRSLTAQVIFLAMPLFVMFALLNVWLALRGLRSQHAVDELRNFRLSHAQCRDDDDREASPGCKVWNYAIQGV